MPTLRLLQTVSHPEEDSRTVCALLNSFVDSAKLILSVYPTPDYQQDAVSAYLAAYPPKFKAYQTEYNESIGANGGVYNSAGKTSQPRRSFSSDKLQVVDTQTFQLLATAFS